MLSDLLGLYTVTMLLDNLNPPTNNSDTDLLSKLSTLTWSSDSDTDDATKVDQIADLLVAILKNPGYREYYCRIAWDIPLNRIVYAVKQALTGNSPSRLFAYLMQLERRRVTNPDARGGVRDHRYLNEN